MSETVSIYAGVKKAAKIRKRALEKEAAHQKTSATDLVWSALRAYGSDQLRAALDEADRIERA